MVKILTAFYALCLLIANAAAQDGSGQPDSSVKFGKLKNGFTYYIKPSAVEKGKIMVRLVVKTGFVNEEPGQANIAHIVEHLGFRALKDFPKGVWDYAERNGMRIGKEINASTHPLHTEYHFTISSEDPRILSDVLLITKNEAADMLMLPQEAEAEKLATISEQSSSGSEDQMATRVMEVIIDNPKHVFDSDKIIADSRRVTREELFAFYKKWYRPEFSAIIVMGDIKPEQVMDQIKSVFESIPASETIPDQPDINSLCRTKLTGKNEVFTVSDPYAKNVKVELIKKNKAVYDPDASFSENLKNQWVDKLIERMMENRFKLSTQRYGLSYEQLNQNVDPNYNETSGLDVFSIRVMPKDVNLIEKSLNDVLMQCRQISDGGFLRKELDLAKSNIRSAVFDVEGLLNESQIYLDHFIKNTPMISGVETNAKVDSILSTDLLSAVNDRIKRLVDFRSDVSIIFLVPDSLRHLLPHEQTVKQWVSRSLTAKPETYAWAEEIPVTLMNESKIATLPVGKIKMEKDIPLTGARDIILTNGIRIILKPVRDPNLKGQIRCSVWGEQSDNASKMIQGLAPSLILNTGLAGYNKFQLKNFFDSKQIQFSLGYGEGHKSAKMIGPVAQAPYMLQALLVFLESPKKDIAAFEDWKINNVVMMKKEQQAPGEVFKTAINARRFAKDISEKKMDINLDLLTLDTLFSSYRKAFNTNTFSDFLITGDFEPAQLMPVLLKYLGVLHGNRSTKKTKSINLPEWPEKKVRYIFNEGNASEAVSQFCLPGYYNGSLEECVKIDLISELLDMFSKDRFRVGGLSYISTGSNRFFGPMANGQHGFSFGIIAYPRVESVEKVTAAVQDIFMTLKTNGIDSVTFEKARQRLLKSRKYDFRLGSLWEKELSAYMKLGIDPSELFKVKTYIENILNLEEINTALKRYIDTDHLQEYYWLPENTLSQIP